MDATRTLFGTDGIRGLANAFPMTAQMALTVGQAIAYLLKENQLDTANTSFPVGLKPLGGQRRVRRAKIVVGKDTRLSGYMIEHALVAGICSMGADAYLVGPLPTPAIAFVTQSMRADAGVMLSASHNPYHDNGIKIFDSNGYKFPDEVEVFIEKLLVHKQMLKALPTHDLIGRAFRIDDALGRYNVYLKSLFPKDLDLMGFRIVLDCAHGAAYKVAPIVFEELGAEVITKSVTPNGLNINDKCGALFPEVAAETTVAFRADLGIALDGDGDRCILSDENGEKVDGDELLGICALEMAKNKTLKRNTVVLTALSNQGLHLALQKAGISVKLSSVGDRYIVEQMRKDGLSLGGEPSGHVIFLEEATTGDGMLSALKVLEAMRRTGKRLSELKRQIVLFPQVLENISVLEKKPFGQFPEIQNVLKNAREKLGKQGRVILRYSGTEPVARLLLEGENSALLQELSFEVKRVLKKHLVLS